MCVAHRPLPRRGLDGVEFVLPVIGGGKKVETIFRRFPCDLQVPMRCRQKPQCFSLEIPGHCVYCKTV